jgi:hypothetical protein
VSELAGFVISPHGQHNRAGTEMRFSKAIAFYAAAIALLSVASSAHAVPILQLYLEGGVYNPVTESWEITPPGSSSGAPFRIWTIGNISGPGGAGTIYNVRLAAVYDEAVGDINISLTPALAGGTGTYGGFTDFSLPSLPTLVPRDLASTEGTVPILGDGKPLPQHGEYGEGRVWKEFLLGNFSTVDSQMGDFIDGFPTPTSALGGQINVYDVSVTGPFGKHPFTIHFDLYDTVYAKNHARSKFAPFSHDADGDATIVPEPGSVTLATLGFLGLVVPFRRRRRLKGLAS